ncbi:MAG TPA: phage tail tube protein [Caulobacteraceae bacterium]|nr:phage tail tube protein [Caulobacteraceae bacterium]
MGAPLKMLGLADVVVDGVTLLSGDDATLDPGGVIRTVVKGRTVQGFQEATAESKLEVSVSIDASFSINTFRNITNATVSFVADTGQTWMINGAWTANPPAIDQKSGKAKITFNGPAATEVL